MKFSQRAGIIPAEKLAQRESIDKDLLNGLWNCLAIFYWNTYRSPGDSMYGRGDYVRGSNLESLIFRLWVNYFKSPIDTIEEYWENCHKELRTYYYKAPWYEVYDFMEFIANNGPEKNKNEFLKACNQTLEKENSAYRFVGDQVAEITSEEEINDVEKALEQSVPYAGVKQHLVTSLTLLSDRVNPDYRNSIKESISSIESLAIHLTRKQSATLGEALRILEKNQSLHPALKKAFSALYGYTSDADGIRHALLEENNLNKADARFMLVCCSAFINYAIDQASNQ